MERREYEDRSEERGWRVKNGATMVGGTEQRDTDEEGASAVLTVAKAGLCAICHLTSQEKDGDETSNVYGEHFSCPEGHIFCHRCRGQFSIRSDTGCILCGKRSQKLHQSSSREGKVGVGLRCGKTDGTYEVFPRFSYDVPRYCAEGGWPSYDVGLNKMDSYGEAGKEQAAACDHRRCSYSSTVGTESSEERGSRIKVNIGQICSAECSRKPIRCPRLDCAVNVAFSALAHHFLFDHPDVPILSVEPGTKSTLIVSFEALSRNSSRCLALLLVSGKLSDPAARLFTGNQIDPRYRKRLPLPVLAARLECTSRFLSPGEERADDRCEKNVIIAWVAGLDIGEATEGLRCSIQAVDRVDAKEVRSLMYTGPVNSLRRAQQPREVFSAGDCIVLHEGLIDRITAERASLQVNVIVH